MSKETTAKGKEVFADLSPTTMEALERLQTINAHGIVEFYADPEYNGLRKVADTEDGKYAYLGRVFVRVGPVYQPVHIKKLAKGRLMAQVNRFRGENEADQEMLGWQDQTDKNAFNRLLEKLPAYLHAIGSI